MAGMDFFIRPATGTGSADWIRIPNADIDVKIARRLTRTIIRGGEGDNLLDEGAESTIYTVRGFLSVDDYKKILKMFRTGQPFIHDPFEERVDVQDLRRVVAAGVGAARLVVRQARVAQVRDVRIGRLRPRAQLRDLISHRPRHHVWRVGARERDVQEEGLRLVAPLQQLDGARRGPVVLVQPLWVGVGVADAAL